MLTHWLQQPAFAKTCAMAAKLPIEASNLTSAPRSLDSGPWFLNDFHDLLHHSSPLILGWARDKPGVLSARCRTRLHIIQIMTYKFLHSVQRILPHVSRSKYTEYRPVIYSSAPAQNAQPFTANTAQLLGSHTAARLAPWTGVAWNMRSPFSTFLRATSCIVPTRFHLSPGFA